MSQRAFFSSPGPLKRHPLKNKPRVTMMSAASANNVRRKRKRPAIARTTRKSEHAKSGKPWAQRSIGPRKPAEPYVLMGASENDG